MSNWPDSAPHIAPLWRIRVSVPERFLDAVQAALDRFGAVVAYADPAVEDMRIDPGADRPADVWRLECLCECEPDISAVTVSLAETVAPLGLAMPDIHVDHLPAIDWLAENRAQFKPIRAGRFFVTPSFDRTPAPPGTIALHLDAGPAFGSGEHPTTSGCLRAIDGLLRRRRFVRALDIGCGSGILALALARLRKRPVLAIDNDCWAVRTTRANARANAVAGLIDARLGDGLRTVSKAARFDLICANILARPLVRLAPSVRRHLTPGGMVILSGLLDYQEAAVRTAYRAQGLRLIGRLSGRSQDGGLWPTLIMSR